MQHWQKHLLICFFLTVVCSIIVLMIIVSQPKVQQQAITHKIVGAYTKEVTLENVRLPLSSRALLQANQEQVLIAPNSGNVSYLAKSFATGGRFSKGDLLLSIDPSLALFELNKAQTQLAQAKLNWLELQASLAANKQQATQKSLSALAKGEPQLYLAKTQLEAAQSAVTLAEKALENTKIYAPFDGRFLQAALQDGEAVIQGQLLGHIYHTSQYRARIPINQQTLKLLDEHSTVNALDSVSGLLLTGKIIRHEGHIANNRLIYLMAEFDNLAAEQQEQLLLGSLLNITVQSREFSNIAIIPALALDTQESVWLIRQEHLKKQMVNVLYRDRQHAYITDGLNTGDKIVTHNIIAAYDNMPIHDLGEKPE